MNNDTSPATKGDLKCFATKQDLEILKTDLEQKMNDVKMELRQEVNALKEELRHDLSLGFETLRHDFVSVWRDEITMLKDADRALDTRVTRIENAAGFAA